MKALIFFILFLKIQSAVASTFVGNGGNVGDVELQTSVRQLRDTLDIIRKNLNDPEMKLCTCYPEMEGRPACAILQNLNADQRRMCVVYIRAQADVMANMLHANESVHFSWTHEPIDVSENGGVRGADAVTDLARKTITINQESFVSRNPMERLFLVSHEIFHLFSYEGKPLRDEGAFGSFKGSSGGRDFINAMAATIVSEAYTDQVFAKYAGTLDRSQVHSKTWLTIGALSQNSFAEGTYAQKDLKGVEFGIRYQLTSEWGLVAGYDSLEAKKTILTTIESSQKNRIFSAGLSYRLIPFADPTTFWGQSNFVVSAEFQTLKTEYHLKDPFVGMDDSKSSNGLTLKGKYFIPLQSGLWLYVGVGYSTLRYGFESLNLDYKDSTSYSLGAVYAF